MRKVVVKMQKSHYNMTDRELKVYKRKLRRQREIRHKLMVGFMTFCLIMVCAVSYQALQSNASTVDEELNFKYYTNIIVEYDETLWDIADEYIDYQEYKDKAAYIAEVQSINHLNGDTIRAGQHLVVPYYSNEFVK